MPTLYSMVNETGSRSRILETCKFRIWFRLGITSTILFRFLLNFACGSEAWLHRRLLFVRQTGSSLPILEMCRFRFRQFLAFTFANCCHPSVCLTSVVCLSVCLSVTLEHPTQTVVNIGNFSTAFGTLTIH